MPYAEHLIFFELGLCLQGHIGNSPHICHLHTINFRFA